MKKKIIITTVLVGLLTLGLQSYLPKQKVAAQYLVMRAYEPIGVVSELVISYGNGKTERIPLKDLKTENHEHNIDMIANTLNRFSDEGYVLVSNSSSGVGNRTSLLHVETFVMVKE